MQSNNYLATICWQMHKFCHKSFPDHFNTIWNSFYIKFLGDTRRLKFMIKPFVQVAYCIWVIPRLHHATSVHNNTLEKARFGLERSQWQVKPSSTCSAFRAHCQYQPRNCSAQLQKNISPLITKSEIVFLPILFRKIKWNK